MPRWNIFCLPLPRGCDFPCRVPIRTHHTPTEKQSPEVAFGNTSFPFATPGHLFDFITYFFLQKNNVAKMQRQPLPPKTKATTRNNTTKDKNTTLARLLLNETDNSNEAFDLFQCNIHIRRRTTMNTILNRFDRLMMAITFAEANAPESAQEYLGSRKPTQNKRAQRTTRTTGGQILPKQTAN
ncbi:MAG: hypothetical protein V1782_11525 [Pseudomonadota bacterium]